jgi:hypothetical protein
MTDVIVFCVLLVALAAFVAGPLYATRVPPASGGREDTPDGTRAAVSDLEIDHASGLIDDQQYGEELADLQARVTRPSDGPTHSTD